jgi:hypothetical protein
MDLIIRDYKTKKTYSNKKVKSIKQKRQAENLAFDKVKEPRLFGGFVVS